MAEIRQNSCCKRAIAQVALRDVTPTHEDIAFLFSMSPRWVTELRKRGVLPKDATLPQMVKIMARHKDVAKRAARSAKLIANAKARAPKRA